MTRIIIQTENMNFSYPDGTPALSDINIEIKDGERIAIVGSNGAGKSTLFSHFNGILKPSSGLIKIDGKEMGYKKGELMEIRQKVGLVFQNPDDQLFAPTVVEDVAFGPRTQDYPMMRWMKGGRSTKIGGYEWTGKKSSTPLEWGTKKESGHCWYLGHAS